MSKNVEKLIGEQIARLRKERELTQSQLAELIDVSTETISRLERGVSIPSIRTLEKISKALHISMKGLFDFEKPIKSKESEIEREATRIMTYLLSKRVGDIRMCFRVLKCITENIEKDYVPKE